MHGAEHSPSLHDGRRRAQFFARGGETGCARSRRFHSRCSGWKRELGEKLLDRSAKDVVLTDAGRTVLEYARRFQNLEPELQNSMAELRDHSAGRLVIGANESTGLYLLRHIERYRRLYPKVKVQVRRSFSSRIPAEIVDGNLELGVISYQPRDERLQSRVIFTDSLAFVVSPKHRLAKRKDSADFRSGRRDFHRAQRGLALSRHRAARSFQERGVRAQHGYRDADRRDDSLDGGSEPGRGVFAAHVRGAGDCGEAAGRGARAGESRWSGRSIWCSRRGARSVMRRTRF